jgi:hypothetical protein
MPWVWGVQMEAAAQEALLQDTQKIHLLTCPKERRVLVTGIVENVKTGFFFYLVFSLYFGGF